MKMCSKIFAISLCWIISQSISGTEFRIRAQDDATLNGLKLTISMPKVIQDGPKGCDIEVIAQGKEIAMRDQDGNFLDYVNVNSKGNRAPTLSAVKLLSLDGDWPPTFVEVKVLDSTRGRSILELPIHHGLNGLYAEYQGSYYYIPRKVSHTHLSYPFDLELKNYLPVEQLPFFDSVSSYGTVWNVLNIFDKIINDKIISYIPGLKETKRRWNAKGTIYIYPHMTVEQFKRLYPEDNYGLYRGNAFYDFRGDDERIQHVLCFFPVDFDGVRYTSQYFDVLSHEGGHFVLNILRPDLWHSESTDIQAFHETFGDITALFAVLSFPELRRMLLDKTNGNLHVSSFLSVIGEGITDRDASQCTRLAPPPSCEEHELSEKLTHALYGILADFVNTDRVDGDDDFEPIRGDGDSLFVQAIEKFQSYFLTATVMSNLTSFVDFGKTLRQSDDRFFNHLVHLNFLRQQIDLTDHRLSPQLCLLPKENDQKQYETMGCATGKVGIRKYTRVMHPSNLHYLRRLILDSEKG